MEKQASPTVVHGSVLPTPYIFEITNSTYPQPTVIFGSDNTGIKSLIPSQEYEAIKEELANKKTILISKIRIDNIFAKTDYFVAIGFRRIVGGETVEKKFIVPFFLQAGQFYSQAVEIPIMGLPLDGKTEVLVYAPSQIQVKLYTVEMDANTVSEGIDYDSLFVKAINSPTLYDDCIEITNPTNTKQTAVLKFTEEGVICENGNVTVTSSDKYEKTDTIYFRKAYFPKTELIPTQIINGVKGHGSSEISTFIALNSFNREVVDIVGRIAVDDSKTISIDLPAEFNYFLFVLKNKVPFYWSNNFFVPHYTAINFNTSGEVRNLLDQINQQAKGLKELLKKDEFPFSDEPNEK